MTLIFYFHLQEIKLVYKYCTAAAMFNASPDINLEKIRYVSTRDVISFDKKTGGPALNQLLLLIYISERRCLWVEI